MRVPISGVPMIWRLYKKNTIRDEGSTALYAAYTVDTIVTVYTVDTFDMVSLVT